MLKREQVPEDLCAAGRRARGRDCAKSDFVHYPLRRGELYNFIVKAVIHSDHYEEGWNAGLKGSKELPRQSISRDYGRKCYACSN